MKMRVGVLGFSLGLILIYLCVSKMLINDTTDHNAAVWRNEVLMKVESGIKKGIITEDTKEYQGVIIVFRSDTEYFNKLNKMYQSDITVIDYEENGQLIAKIGLFDKKKSQFSERIKMKHIIQFLILTMWMLGMGLFYYIFHFYVNPFRKLKAFTSEIAKGNLEAPLWMNKRNYFGLFTESFDIMREELKRAKENEYRANISKKELVAELSHDIKTPIASIKAACEILQVKEKNFDTVQKVEIIEKKAEYINQLISNLFHVTLEELEELKVKEEEATTNVIIDMLYENNGFDSIVIENEIPECLVYMDQLRMKQVLDNIIYNSMKYAKTKIYINFKDEQNGIVIRIHDKGLGVSEEDLSKVTQKFYRGSNASSEEGSGLGLYLAALFMEKMHGTLQCYNDNGFVVELFLKKAGNFKQW